jgi:hypothetical protein
MNLIRPSARTRPPDRVFALEAVRYIKARHRRALV